MKVRAEQNDGGGPGGLVGRRVRLDETSEPYTTLEPGHTGQGAFTDDRAHSTSFGTTVPRWVSCQDKSATQSSNTPPIKS